MSLTVWLTDSLHRTYPSSPNMEVHRLLLHAARGERVAFQVCFQAADHGRPATVGLDVQAPDALGVRIRRVGFVPVPHHNTDTPTAELDGVGNIPGYVPDPLFDETEAAAPWNESGAFWCTVTVPRDAQPGDYPLACVASVDGEARPPVMAHIRVHDVVLAQRRGFPVTQWFYSDALLDWYGLTAFEPKYWDILRPYLRNQVEHGQNSIHTPLFTPPTDGVKRPTQLLSIRKDGDTYSFDFSDVARYVRMAKEEGAEHFEWPHFFSQWGAKHPSRFYLGQGTDERLLWDPETAATSSTYRTFLEQLIPTFRRFLEDEGILDASFFHVSDEPHGDEQRTNYQAARSMLKEVAPWMKTMDAISEIEYGKLGLTDIPIPVLRTVNAYREAGIPSFAYFCCGPRGEYPNRLLDTPLAKIRMFSWISYRLRIRGFLHWGYNYWYRSQTRELIDPFVVTDGHRWPNWAYGDTFVVYPGPNGPIDSIRWEVFAAGLSDYALLQSLEVTPEDPALAAVEDYTRFPRAGEWIRTKRQELLTGIAQ
jgi:hypothetical protein